MHLRTYPQALSATDGDWLCRPFVTPGGRLSVGLICKKIGRETVSLPKIMLNVYGKLRVSRFFFKAFVTLFLKSSYQPSSFYRCAVFTDELPQTKAPLCKGSSQRSWLRDCFSLNQCIYERILRRSPQQMETGYADLLSLPAGGFLSVWYARKSAEKQYLCRKLCLMFMENCVFRASFSKLSWLCF